MKCREHMNHLDTGLHVTNKRLRETTRYFILVRNGGKSRIFQTPTVQYLRPNENDRVRILPCYLV